MAGVSLITGGKGKSDRSETDLYPTPYPSTNSLLKYLLQEGYLFNDILEPCAGLGHISKACELKLKDWHKSSREVKITSRDLFDYTSKFKYVYEVETNVDFLNEDLTQHQWVITNPPFDKDVLMPIIEKSLSIATEGVAMFLKGTFLETKNRMQFFKENKQLKYVLIFANRQPLYKNGIVTGASNAIMYAWFIWDKNYDGLPTIDWLDNSEEVKNTEIY